MLPQKTLEGDEVGRKKKKRTRYKPLRFLTKFKRREFRKKPQIGNPVARLTKLSKSIPTNQEDLTRNLRKRTHTYRPKPNCLLEFQ